MNKLGSLTGVGALLLNGSLIAKAQYEIMVNGDETRLRLAFASMQVSDQAIKVMEQSSGNYTLSLEKSGVVDWCSPKSPGISSISMSKGRCPAFSLAA